MKAVIAFALRRLADRLDPAGSLQSAQFRWEVAQTTALIRENRDRLRATQLPSRARLEARDLLTPRQVERGRSFARRARGVPYLWGGVR